jgi:hypothetical protein
LLLIVFSRGFWIPFHPAYQASGKAAMSSKDLASWLGSNWGTGLGARGVVINSGGMGYAKIKIPVHGSKGEGTLYAMVRSQDTIWQTSEMVLQQGGVTRTIIPSAATDLSLPATVATGKIYLLPLGNPDVAQLERSANQLSERFHVSIRVLPKEAIDPAIEDSSRKQLVGERLLQTVRIAHPELTDDYDAFVIAVTDRDMYLKQYDWNFAFGLRGYGRFGVISTARLPLRSDLGSPFFAETRLRSY